MVTQLKVRAATPSPLGTAITSPAIDIKDILTNHRLVACFQPIVSVNGGGLRGVEGLSRATLPDGSGLISPLALFAAAAEQDMQIELDRSCRDNILRTFKACAGQNGDTLLFINLDSSILDKVVGSNYLVNMVRQLGFAPEDIVIEINETQVQDTALLQQFVQTYRRHGFLLALDDVGAGCSNLDRLSLVRPDIVKTDICLARNIDRDFYVKEVFRSLVKLSTKIGALVVAEGVETQEEAVQVLSLGAQMIQGYCFSRPVPLQDIEPVRIAKEMNAIAEKFRITESSHVMQQAQRYWKLDDISRNVTARMARSRAGDFNGKLEESIRQHEEIECAYVLNEKGVQVSGTVFNRGASLRYTHLFSPAVSGADHSLKVYYRQLKNAELDKFLTEPYASLASGNLCRTFSSFFRARDRRSYVLCLDFKVNPMES